jgi:ABC-type multidrug transport system ATPase subunit
MNAVVRTEGLTKAYGRLTVVEDVDLEVFPGDVFGFLGPNGSGKTTTIRMLLGLVGPTSGRVELLGRPMPDAASTVLEQVGALVEGPGFYPTMSGRRNLALFDAAGRSGKRSTRRGRIAEALERVGLGNVDRRPVRAYSLGMRQRLGLAAALIRQPRLLVLDEPTNGLDPQGIREIRALLAELATAGTTVFLSSHLLGEVELICTRAAMMAQGRLVAQDTVEHLLAPTGRLVIDTPDVDAAMAVLGLRGGGRVDREGDRVRVMLNGHRPEELNHALVHAGVRVRELVVERRSLEDAYLGLTGGSGDARR